MVWLQFLELVLISSVATGDCPICMCELGKDDVVQMLQCVGHQFHKDCLAHCIDERGPFLRCPSCFLVYGVRVRPTSPSLSCLKPDSSRLVICQKAPCKSTRPTVCTVKDMKDIQPLSLSTIFLMVNKDLNTDFLDHIILEPQEHVIFLIHLKAMRFVTSQTCPFVTP